MMCGVRDTTAWLTWNILHSNTKSNTKTRQTNILQKGQTNIHIYRAHRTLATITSNSESKKMCIKEDSN